MKEIESRRNSNRYIEAINGARKARNGTYFLYDLNSPWFYSDRETEAAWFRWWFTLSHDPAKQAAYQR